jgi:AcrR family transcriptional regulator
LAVLQIACDAQPAFDTRRFGFIKRECSGQLGMKKSSPPMSQRERNKSEKLRRIKKAALELFISKGFDEATTREIAVRAEVGLGTVFVYAETKHDLLFLIVNDDLRACVDKAAQLVRKDRSLLENLIVVLRLHYEYFAKVPELSRQVLREMHFYRSGKQAVRFSETRERLVRLLTKLISQAMAERLIYSVESPEFVAQTIFALYQVNIRRWLMNDGLDLKNGLDNVSRQIMLVMTGLSARPEAVAINR